MSLNEALRQLMLGLIYPAVLGTVFYSVLDAELSPLISFLNGGTAGPLAPTIKWILVLTTVTFYVCDYLYIMFTREFRVVFFVCDLMLLVGLYVTFKTIDLTNSILPGRNLIVLAASYGSFMFIYLVWDFLERLRTQDRAEQKFYNNVIYWEVVSMIALGYWLWSQDRVQGNSRNAALLAALLVLITIRFGAVAMGKRVFYKPPSTDCHSRVE